MTVCEMQAVVFLLLTKRVTADRIIALFTGTLPYYKKNFGEMTVCETQAVVFLLTKRVTADKI